MLTTTKLGLNKPETTDARSALRTAINANADTLEARLGQRKKASITGSESRTNTAYGLLTTPDQVTGIILPTDGIIAVSYRALWQESVNGASRAAIFLGSNQLQVQTGGGPAVTSALSSGTINSDHPLTTFAAGLLSTTGLTTGGFTVSTGSAVAFHAATTAPQVDIAGTPVALPGGFPLGGLCLIEAAAGTYDISVQFKASSGSVTASKRLLRVWVETF